MYFENLSANNLVGLASSLAIAISNDLDSEQSGLLAAFLTAVADNLAIIAIQKAKELGVKFVPATGRGYNTVDGTLKELSEKWFDTDITVKPEGSEDLK